ncbi:MAG: M20/M25/M40 family metallo-hydrolase [Opitutus sp.]
MTLPLTALAQTNVPGEKLPLAADAKTVNLILEEALAHAAAYENLRTLTSQSPGRLSGSKSLERAVVWAERTLTTLKLDRVYRQNVMVPHWERGARESVRLLPSQGEAIALPALALGGSGPSPSTGVIAEVVEVHSLAELASLGRDHLAGKIAFFNRPMNSGDFRPAYAYGNAGDQRNRGPAAAAAFGAIAVLTRSLTHSIDDIPHTGNTSYPPNTEKIPAAALSTRAADRLSVALAADPKLRVEIKINSRWLPDAASHNVIGEIRGTEFPEQIIVVGAHLDSWDIAPGAHDDGAGVVQAIEVLRIFQALGLKPRHTLRCVLFTAEENSGNGGIAYAAAAKSANERHVFAIESDNGGFAPSGFELGSTQGEPHLRAERWRSLFEPWGIWHFAKGPGGSDVGHLMLQGVTVAEIKPNSQRYFDYHHTTIDSIDKVNPRELHLGAGALAAFVWLVDTQGL